jgi:Zn-dependent M28 family amino/carboxypeptidase
VIFNEGQPGRDGVLTGTLGATDAFEIPVVGTSFEVGEELNNLDQQGDAVVRVTTDTSVEKRTTRNVIGRTPEGSSGRAVVVGAHLDSVEEGPGINDNGSGSASILEIAEQMSELDIEPRNQVRFAFWGAEESGLIGSTYYVSQLSEEGLGNIMVNLNFDMLGSPNYVRFVYDGDGSDEPSTGPDGSGKVERVFNNYFASRGLETEPTAFDGRSDYKPFIDNGIPGGGLFSGAEGIKSPEEATTYGGVAGAPYDPCYHQACDDINNLNPTALSQLSDGAAHATYAFAKTKQPVTDGTVQAQSQKTSSEASTYLGTELQK